MNTQEQINALSDSLRMAVIVYLIQTDLLECNSTKGVDEKELEWRAKQIFEMPCCTAQLKSLFSDCHDLQRERGQFPTPVSIMDLRYCLKNRYIGFGCKQNLKLSWLPKKEDRELRGLKEFKAIAGVYKKLIAAGKSIIAPKRDSSNEISLIVENIQRRLTA